MHRNNKRSINKCNVSQSRTSNRYIEAKISLDKTLLPVLILFHVFRIVIRDGCASRADIPVHEAMVQPGVDMTPKRIANDTT